MAADKHHDLASQQLHLFESAQAAAVIATVAEAVDISPTDRPVLRLISRTMAPPPAKVTTPVERLAAIEARLIDRAKYF